MMDENDRKRSLSDDPVVLTNHLIKWYCQGSDEQRQTLEQLLLEKPVHGEEVIFYLKKMYASGGNYARFLQ